MYSRFGQTRGNKWSFHIVKALQRERILFLLKVFSTLYYSWLVVETRDNIGRCRIFLNVRTMHDNYREYWISSQLNPCWFSRGFHVTNLHLEYSWLSYLQPCLKEKFGFLHYMKLKLCCTMFTDLDCLDCNSDVVSWIHVNLLRSFSYEFSFISVALLRREICHLVSYL